METNPNQAIIHQLTQGMRHSTNKGQAARHRISILQTLKGHQLTLMIGRLQLGWQSASARILWSSIISAFAQPTPQTFIAAQWIAANLDLCHPPVSERDTPLLASLSVEELNLVYHTMSTIAASPDWQDFAWDTFTDLVERELAMEQ